MFWFVVMTFVCGKDATVTLKKRLSSPQTTCLILVCYFAQNVDERDHEQRQQPRRSKDDRSQYRHAVQHVLAGFLQHLVKSLLHSHCFLLDL